MSERPIFGVHRDPGVAEANFARNKAGTLRENPLVHIYGPDPEARRCYDCIHLLVVRQARNYYKCELRRMSGSAATDHRATWPACARFEEAPDANQPDPADQ